MADNAFAYAKDRNLIRKNEIHGETEAKLILEEYFGYRESEGQESTEQGSFSLEAA